MGSEESADRVFEQRDCSSILNYPSSVLVGGKNSISDPFYGGNNWDPIVSLSQSGNFGNEFANPTCSVLVENQKMGSSSHLVQFPSDSGLVDIMPKIPSFGSGSFSEMGNGTFGHIAESGYNSNFTNNGVGIQRKRKIPVEASSKNAEEEQQRDLSGDTSELPKEDDEKEEKFDGRIGLNSRCKQAVKQLKDDSAGLEPSKENYIHVRAKRGQATNSHSLAERVRRERISERMRLLQELVPGCNKITGKAMMLDEIINYVQSLQQQVEFLSMKLATVNPELNVDIDRILSKDILHLRDGNATALGIAPGLSTPHSFPIYPQGTFNSAPGTTTPPFNTSLPQHMWNNELQGLLQMGFDPDPSISNLGPNGP